MKKIPIHPQKGNFFKILDETEKSQVGVMTISPGSDSGPEEVHDGDQIVYIIDGQADIEIDHEKQTCVAGELVTIPAGSQHHIFNSGADELFFLTIYTPPQY